MSPKLTREISTLKDVQKLDLASLNEYPCFVEKPTQLKCPDIVRAATGKKKTLGSSKFTDTPWTSSLSP